MRFPWGTLTRTPKTRQIFLVSCGRHFQRTLLPHNTQHTRLFSSTLKSPRTNPLSAAQDADFLINLSNPKPSARDEVQWESLLDRGLAYGIKSRAQLCLEADVGHVSHIGARLIDAPHLRHDIELWEILLIAQALQNGHEGIKAIWKGMKFRGEAFRLDGNDPRVDALWKTFLAAGAEDHQFLWSLCKEAKNLTYNRPRLFTEIVGAALEGTNPLEAVQFAVVVGKEHYRGREDLLAIFSAACHSRNAAALEAFCRIYDLVSGGQVYDEITTTLWAQDRSADAFMMHSFLISRKDLPLQFSSLEPFINNLALQNKSLDKFLSPLTLAGTSFEAQARRLWSIGRSRITGIPADSLNIVASKTMGSMPNKLSDPFIARAFATRAFSFDFAVNSLRMIGLSEVGPLAVRQLASSSPDLATLRARFQKLEELDVDTGASAFVRILRNVCDAGHWTMVQALVNNDLHHEVFEDAELQKRLLVDYYRSQDWRQLNRTLVVLNDGRFDEDSRGRSANLLLRVMVATGDWRAALNCAATLQEHNYQISSGFPRSLDPFFHTPRQVTIHPDSNEIDKTAFLIGMMQMVLASGTNIKTRFWRRAIKALGQQGRLLEVEAILYWIAEWLKAGGLNEEVNQKPLSGRWNNISLFVDDKFQKALMSWCFRPRKGSRLVSAERCLRWTRILKRLRDEYGVEVHEHVIRWAFIKRLRRLFATGMQLKGSNAWVRARNRFSISRYWELYDQMWDMKPSGQVNYDDRVQICLQHRTLSPLRSRHLQNRRQRLVDKLAVRTRTQPEDGDNTAQGSIVVYRDLFNASWEDYRK